MSQSRRKFESSFQTIDRMPAGAGRGDNYGRNANDKVGKSNIQAIDRRQISAGSRYQREGSIRRIDRKTVSMEGRYRTERPVSGGSQNEYAGEYIYGNTVLKPEPQRRQQEIPAKKPNNEVRKNRDKARHMSIGYVLFLVTALCTAAFILVNYIQLQADLTNLTESVSSKESRLNYLKGFNDEEYSRIVSSIDLEEIKRIAMGELGMIYAQEGQIIEYEGKSNDYMRQVTESNH